MHREGGILSTWEGRRGFRASIVVHFCFGEWRIVFDRVDCPLVNPCAYEGLPRLRNEAPEYLLRQSGGCMPRRVRRLAGDAEAVGALACLRTSLTCFFPHCGPYFAPRSAARPGI